MRRIRVDLSPIDTEVKVGEGKRGNKTGCDLNRRRFVGRRDQWAQDAPQWSCYEISWIYEIREDNRLEQLSRTKE